MWLIIALVIMFLSITVIYAFPLIEVCGDSMNPTLKDGDIVLGFRLFTLRRNRIYVYKPPVEGHKYVIKRLTYIKDSSQVCSKTPRLFFEGDNPDYSYDSRMYGYVSADKVVAQYLFTIYRRKECSDNECK